MASSMAGAFARVEKSPAFDHIVYPGCTVRRTQPDRAVAAAFERFDYGHVRRIVRQLSRRCRCSQADAEEAVHEEYAHLLEREPELFREDPESWIGLLYRRAFYRLLQMRNPRRRCASIEALMEAAGDEPFRGARPCLAPSLNGDEEARYLPLPRPGESWSWSQVVGAFQRFRDYHGRPPRVSDCKAANRLPCYASIRRHFGSFDEALIAAGMVPTGPGRRRRRWSSVEAARVCRSFRHRHGYWPSCGDLQRDSEDLPSPSTMIRCFGSTRPAQVQIVAEAILRNAEAGRPPRRR